MKIPGAQEKLRAYTKIQRMTLNAEGIEGGFADIILQTFVRAARVNIAAILTAEPKHWRLPKGLHAKNAVYRERFEAAMHVQDSHDGQKYELVFEDFMDGVPDRITIDRLTVPGKTFPMHVGGTLIKRAYNVVLGTKIFSLQDEEVKALYAALMKA